MNETTENLDAQIVALLDEDGATLTIGEFWMAHLTANSVLDESDEWVVCQRKSSNHTTVIFGGDKTGAIDAMKKLVEQRRLRRSVAGG